MPCRMNEFQVNTILRLSSHVANSFLRPIVFAGRLIDSSSPFQTTLLVNLSVEFLGK